MTKDLFSIPEFKSLLVNPPREKLRELAKKDEQTTEYGSPCYVTRVRSRSAKFTKNSIDQGFDEGDLEELRKLLAYLKEKGEMLQIDRKMGRGGAFHCRLYVSKAFARIALGWSDMLEPWSGNGKPDMVTVMVPEWPVVKILIDAEKAVTFAVGSDYTGESKKSFLRMWMYLVKKKGWLGLHAGSKLLHLTAGKGGIRRIGQLYFGLSATGKSTLTGHGFYLKNPEKAELIQDDVVALRPDGFCIGTEGKGLYIKTEGITKEEQPELYHAVTQPSAFLENIAVGTEGKVNFADYELTSNGRAVVQRSELNNASKDIDMERADQLFFITRNPIMPPIARLNPKKAGVAFMLGESVESSAGDPTKAGQSVRVVGTNPFIMGKPGSEGNILVEILAKNPGMECYIINTGYVGEGEERAKVKIPDTVGFIERAARKTIEWVSDKELLLEIPKEVIGSAFDPRRK
ncbi:MAG: phosphoenolpyruvate carboxykinase [Candidatus Diapherotrites archaeon]|nr:phosphoenolpyruvate carboxykinase [Candidatus Diapherotrites archaeon]